MPATPDPLKATAPAALDGLDDAALVRRSLAGEAEAFAMLIRRHERRVFALVSAGLGGPARRADVEDCAQESLLAGYRGLGALRDPGEFGPWLLGIAKNQIRQSLKRRGRRRESPLPEDLQASDAGGGEDILEALARLPEPEREAVALRHLTGHSPAEIAEALGLPDGTVRSRISRGLERLRGILGKERIP